MSDIAYFLRDSGCCCRLKSMAIYYSRRDESGAGDACRILSEHFRLPRTPVQWSPDSDGD